MIIVNKTNKGSLLIDIVLAISISLFFIIIITESSFSAQNIFQKAKHKKDLILDYDFDNPKSSVLYGNYSIEKYYNSTSSSLGFIEIGFPENYNLYSGSSPVCSVDFTKHNVVGSYEYFKSKDYKIDLNSLNVNITPINLPTDPLIPLTDIEVRNNIAYISTDSTKQSDPDILIFDISKPNNVQQLSSLNTGFGLASIVLVGKRIYAVAPSTSSQIHIIRLNTLADLILENYYKLPLPYATATPARGSAIAYNDNKLILGTEKWDGDEVNIIDISNPISPNKITGLEIGSKVNDILIDKEYAYISSANYNQLIFADLRNILEPKILQTFSPSGWQRQDGKVSYLFEQYLDFGRTSGGFDLTNDHEYFSWKNPSTTEDYISMNISGGVYGIIRDRSAVYLATRKLDKEFQIFTTDSSGLPILASTSSVSYSLPFVPQTMTCDGDSIYILANNAPFIYKIDFQ